MRGIALARGVYQPRNSPTRAVKIGACGTEFAIPRVLTILVGLSRVYLGVHWPTDVLAGWAAGAAWGLMIWCVAFWLQQRGQIEPDH